MAAPAFLALTLLPLVATSAFFGAEESSRSQIAPERSGSAADAARHYYERLGFSIVGQQGASVRIVEIDLNNDGEEDALIHVESLDTCGTAGCDLLIASSDRDGIWTVINVVSGTWLPIGILPETSNGWRDISVSIGPDVARAQRRLRFVGRYSPEFNLVNLAPVVADNEGDILLR